MKGCYLRYAEKRITCHVLCDNFCCKIASENGILILLVVCRVERQVLSLNQTTSHISRLFCKTDANYVSQRKMM